MLNVLFKSLAGRRTQGQEASEHGAQTYRQTWTGTKSKGRS